MTMALSLNVLQESWDRSNAIYAEHYWAINRLHASRDAGKVESADTLVGNTYRKLAALEQERRKHFNGYYEKRGIKCYPVEAIHVGIAGGTEFSEPELRRLAKSLSFVPLNINHANDERLRHLPNRRALPYPSNQSLVMKFDPMLEGITGFIQLDDLETNSMIKAGKINSVSIEYLSVGGRDGIGIVGTGLALVTSDVPAADRRARIFN